MNKWCSWRKPMLGQLLPSPERDHSVSSWVPLTWKAFWEQLQSWVHSCMVQGMSGLAKPIFIFMMVNSPVHRQMRRSFICSNRTVACLVRTSLPRPLWRHCKITSRTTTRYVVYTSLWLTCGGLGSTILLELERSLINFGVFLMAMTHIGWAHSGQMAQSHLFVAVDLLMDMLWMALNIRVTWCGLKGMGNPILFWIPPQLTRFLSIMISFAHWVWNTSMIPLHWGLKLVSVGKLCTCLAWEQMNSCLTCISPEMGCCVLGLVPIKNIVSTMWHGQTDRTKVSADVIQLAAHEVDTAPEQAVSDGDASDSEGSESASDSDQNDPPSSLVADAEQYELMQIAYAAVGKDFTGQEDLIGSEYRKLQKLEMVPERWPLARLSFSLQTCVDHLDRVLAGCCWEVQATRTTPSESLLSLHQVAKCLTMKLAVHLAKEVAAILRAVLTHETKKLYNDSTVHLLCSNYWIQPIYQELLHSSSRYNATREGERKRPSSGLARVAAYPKPPKQRKPSASGTSFSDWIGGTCYADTLQVWFPAHWAPVVLQQLQQKEDNYRAENPSWMDQEEAPADILKQWQEARANRRMQFKVGNYRDGSWESNIRMLTGTIKVDWIQLPVEPYLAALPTLQQGVIAGVFRQKGAAQWSVFGGLVCRGVWPTNRLAWGFHVGCWQSSQSCWLWFSSPEEEVWCQNHVGGSWPTMATITESARD